MLFGDNGNHASLDAGAFVVSRKSLPTACPSTKRPPIKQLQNPSMDVLCLDPGSCTRSCKHVPTEYGLLSKLWPLLGTLNIRCRIIIVIQEGTKILTTTHMEGTLPHLSYHRLSVLMMAQGEWSSSKRNSGYRKCVLCRVTPKP